MAQRTIPILVDLAPHVVEFRGVELMLTAEKLLEHRAHLILVDAVVLVLVECIPNLSDRIDLFFFGMNACRKEQKKGNNVREKFFGNFVRQRQE